MKQTLSAVLILLFLIGIASAQSYILSRSSINSGGRPATGSGYALNGSAGQTVQGTGAGTGYLGYWGFWYFPTGSTPPSSETGWVRKTDLPLGIKSKRVKDGAALAYLNLSDRTDRSDPSYVYALKGNGRYEFYAYNLTDNTWTAKESIPAIGTAGKKKAVKKGSALLGMTGKVYGCKGGGTLEFWEYDPTTGHWTQKADVTAGAKTLKEGAGAVGVNVSGTDYIYLLKGSGTQEFYRYNIGTGIWEARASAPLGTSGKAYKNGSALATDGTTIWAVKGSYNEVFAYNIATDAWLQKTTLPLIGSLGKKKKVKDGAGMAHHGSYVYALKGGNTNEFWRYQYDSDKWLQMPDIPAGTGKMVKGGGALVGADNALYAFKGNNTLDFFKYGIAAVAKWPSDQVTKWNTLDHATTGPLGHCALRVAPNPFSTTTTISYSLPSSGNVSLKVFDVTGKIVTTLANGYQRSGSYSLAPFIPRSLSSGIYLLKLETESGTTTSKLIVE